MALLTHPAFGPRASLIYITVGALLDVWVAVWYFAFGRSGDSGDASGSNTVTFWLLGLFLTGLTLLVIGILLGQIGRAARRAELPPAEAMTAEAAIQRTDAAVPNVAMPGMAVNAGMGVQPGVPVGVPGVLPGQPVAPAAVPTGYAPAAPNRRM